MAYPLVTALPLCASGPDGQARDHDPDRSAVGIAATAGIVAWAVAAGFFDILSFEQAPNMLFLVASRHVG